MIYLDIDLLGDGIHALSIQVHGKRDHALYHRRLQRDLHRPIVKAVIRVGNVFLVHVHVTVVAHQRSRAVVDRLKGRRGVGLEEKRREGERGGKEARELKQTERKK